MSSAGGSGGVVAKVVAVDVDASIRACAHHR
jgi:hypothetical protein